MLRGKNNDGSSIIEFAIIAPILLLLVFAVIEFGMFFTNKASIQNAVSIVANTVQTVSPNSSADDAFKINNDIVKLVSAFNIKELNNPSNFCGKSFVRLDDASAFIRSNNPCSISSGFRVGRTDASNKIGPNDTYFVGLVAEIAYTAQTPFAALSKIFMPSSVVKTVVQVGNIPNASNASNDRVSCSLGINGMKYSCIVGDGTLCTWVASAPSNWNCSTPSGWTIDGNFSCTADINNIKHSCVGSDGTLCTWVASAPSGWNCSRPSGWIIQRQ